MKQLLLILLASIALFVGWMFVTGQRLTHDPPPTGFLFETIEVRGQVYDYAVYVPRPPATGRLGAVVFLHGRGECGTDGSLQLTVGLPLEIMQHPDRWPFVVVIPQKPAPDDEWEDHVAAVHAMLDRALEHHGLDPDRVHLTGLSQGGHGAWVLGARDPDRWASVVPVCGYLSSPADEEAIDATARELAEALVGVPVWAFHGAEDPIVSARHSEAGVEALRAAGGDARLSLYEGVGHDSWLRAYEDEELARWMRERRRGQ